MTNSMTNVFVSHIGINRINLSGKDVDYYASLPNAEVVERKIVVKGVEDTIKTAIISFDNEIEMIKYLQKLVDLGIRFTDNEKSVAYFEACKLKKRGALRGLIQGC